MSGEAAEAQSPEGTTDTGAGGEQNRQEEHSPQAQPQGGEPAPDQGGQPEGSGEPQPQEGAPKLSELLSEDLQGDETLQNYSSVDEMARELKELKGQAQGPPEQYDLNLDLPDDIPQELREVAERDAEQVKGIAKELGLSNEAAQKLLDYESERQTNFQQSLQEYADNQIQKELETYKEQRGDAFNEDLKNGRAFVQAFGDEDVNTWLDETGLGNHPKLIKMLAEAGKQLQEHDIIKGAQQAPGASGTSLADRLYSAPPVNEQKSSE